MKAKFVFLIFLIAFATVATSVTLCTSNSQTVKRNVDFAKSDGITRVTDGNMSEPQGIAIGTPDMPG